MPITPPVCVLPEIVPRELESSESGVYFEGSQLFNPCVYICTTFDVEGDSKPCRVFENGKVDALKRSVRKPQEDHPSPQNPDKVPSFMRSFPVISTLNRYKPKRAT